MEVTELLRQRLRGMLLLKKEHPFSPGEKLHHEEIGSGLLFVIYNILRKAMTHKRPKAVCLCHISLRQSLVVTTEQLAFSTNKFAANISFGVARYSQKMGMLPINIYRHFRCPRHLKSQLPRGIFGTNCEVRICGVHVYIQRLLPLPLGYLYRIYHTSS